MKITLNTALVNDKWIIFPDTEDLTQYDESKLSKWVFEMKPSNVKTSIQVSEGVKVASDSPAYTLSYKVSYLKVHCKSISGVTPYESDEPKELIDSLPENIVHAIYNKVSLITVDELESLKIKKEDK